MTREEQIKEQAAKEKSVFGENGFIRGANWADSHPNLTSMPTKFKAKCVKADPLKTLEVGETYDCISWNGKVIVGDGTLALGDGMFNELFSRL